MKRLFLGMLAAFLCAAPSLATETVNYTYDALGRLVSAANTGDMNNGQTSATSFDNAGNRTNYGVTVVTTLSIGNASVTEGGNLSFTVTRIGYTNTAVGASWATSSGTAISGTDFTANSGTVSFAAGETSKTVTVATIDDTTAESSETLSVTLSAPTGGAVLGTATGTGTIVDNDSTTAYLAIGNASATEGGNVVFTVNRSGNLTNAVSVNYATAGGTAVSGTDFTAKTGTLNFVANQTSNTISVTTINDTAVESSEAFTVTLSGASSGSTILTAVGTGTIVDNDVAWTSTLTAGAWTICYFSCGATMYGYMPSAPPGSTGSMTNTVYNGYTITALYSVNGSITFTLTGATTPPNSGWTSIVIPGVGTLQRTTATTTTTTTARTWTWTNASQVVSGTVTIQ